MVQLSHAYMTTWKIIAFTIRTFVGKVMSLLFLYALEVCHSFPSKEQVSFNFTAAVTVCSGFGAQGGRKKIFHCFHFFPFYLPWSDWMLWSLFFECWVLNQLFHCSFTLIKRLFSSSSLSAIRVIASAYLRWWWFLPTVLIPTCDSSSLAFRMMYSAYKLKKQVTIYSLDILLVVFLSQFWTRQLFCVRF